MHDSTYCDESAKPTKNIKAVFVLVNYKYAHRTADAWQATMCRNFTESVNEKIQELLNKFLAWNLTKVTLNNITHNEI